MVGRFCAVEEGMGPELAGLFRMTGEGLGDGLGDGVGVKIIWGEGEGGLFCFED